MRSTIERTDPGGSAPAVKVFWLVARADAVTDDAFGARWDALGAPEVTGLRRYAQVLPLRAATAAEGAAAAAWVFGPSFPYGGVAELWFDDVDAWSAAQDAVRDHLAAGLGDAFDADGSPWVVTREHVVRSGAPMTATVDTVKGLFFPQRLAGVSVREFREHWLETHAPLALETPHLLRYAQGHSVDEAYRDGAQPAFDGVAQLWWSTAADVLDAAESHTFQITQPQDAATFVDPSTLFGTLGVERRILWPTDIDDHDLVGAGLGTRPEDAA